MVGSSLILKKEKLAKMVTRCHLLSLVIPLVVSHCHSLSIVVPLVVIRCYSFSLVLLLVVTRCTTRCHSLSFVITRCTIRCHSLSLDVPLVYLFIKVHWIDSNSIVYSLLVNFLNLIKKSKAAAHIVFFRIAI